MKLTWKNCFDRSLTEKRMMCDTGNVSIIRDKARMYNNVTRASRKRIDRLKVFGDNVGGNCTVFPNYVESFIQGVLPGVE